MGWYNANWNYRVEVTLDHTKIVADEVDFPVILTETHFPAAFWGHVQADGEDIVVTGSDGETKQSRELVDIDTVAETMELATKIPALDSSIDNIVKVYYGNVGATETNDEDTWDSNFKAVYHMNDDPDTSHIKDSTSNHNHGTKKAANEPNEVDGLVGKAQDFDGDDDLIDTAPVDLLGASNDLTLEVIVTPADSQKDYADIIDHSHDSYCNFVLQQRGSTDNKFYISFWDGSNWQGGAIETQLIGSAVNYFAGVKEATTMTHYLAGIAGATGAVDADMVTASRILRFGQINAAFDRHFDGLEHEVRISDIARSAEWIKATYNNLIDNANFYSVGAEIIAPPSAFSIVQNTLNGIEITWTKPISAEKTVIRGEEGSYPTDIADGYEVYNDIAELKDIEALEIYFTKFYFRAWSYDATDGYSDEYAEDYIGGAGLSDILDAITAAHGVTDGLVDAVELKLDSPDNFKADVSALALEATLTAIKGAGWTDENLTTIDALIDAIKAVIDALPDGGALTTIQTDLDNPDQYKADIAALALEASLVATLAILQGEHVTIQADLDDPDQYKADIAALALEATLAAHDALMQAILAAIEGAGFVTGDDSLVAIKDVVDAIASGAMPPPRAHFRL